MIPDGCAMPSTRLFPADAVVVNELIVHRAVLDRYLERSRGGATCGAWRLGQGCRTPLDEVSHARPARHGRGRGRSF